MYRKIRFVAFLCCLIPLIGWLVGRTVLRVSGGPYGKPNTAVVHRHAGAPPSDSGRIVAIIPIVLGFAGAVVLFIDALKRQSDSPKAISVAVATVGLLSFGMASVFYYLIWGMKARESPPPATTLCSECIGQTRDRKAPAVRTHNLMGATYIGASDPCPQCGSTIRTLWMMFLVPIVPLGSYRMITVGKSSLTQSQFTGRKLARLMWLQVLSVYIMIGLIAGLLVALFA